MRAPGLRREVVRGSARRIIVLPPPEDGPFERAVFVLRPDAEPVSEAELLREAMAAAAPFSAGEARGLTARERLRRALPWILCADSGAAAGALGALAL